VQELTVSLNDEVHDRFVEYRRTGDRRMRDELVEEHVGLAEYLARRFADRGESFDDLRQVALVGLLKAVERFEPDRGLRFSTFATPTIVGELKRHFRDRGWAVRVPRRVQELHLQLVKVVSTLSQELGRSPTPEEIAKRTGTRVEDVLEAMEAGGVYRLASLDAALANEERSSLDLSARLGEDDLEFDGVERREELSALLAHLPPRERRIVFLRFFEGLTQSEIATEIGISQMHVSRLLAKSLETLRAEARTAAPS
jgi:RNA polymerase sigma-B factor